MNLKEFCRTTNLSKANELERVRLLAFFYQATSNQKEFTVSDIRKWFEELNFSNPNCSRLLKNIRKSRTFTKGKTDSSFKLHATELSALQNEYPDVCSDSEDIESNDLILPRSLYKNTRGYNERIADQINASYQRSLFDGCAVLMRRLLEILLILTYKKLDIQSEIKNSNHGYVDLKTIIDNANSNIELDLSREVKSTLDEFRKLGNFSAHRIEYNCRKPEIDKVKLNYRLAVEELLYKSGILK